MTSAFDDFETTYRSHVEKVVNGDLKGVMADMDPASLPGVFEGVTTPRGEVATGQVLGVRVDGKRAIGEAVYVTPAATIWLRSGWTHDGTAWKADHLENFEPAS